MSSRKGTQPLGGFGAWDIDVPYLVGTFDATYKWDLGGNGATNRCSELWYPATREGMQLSELWSGTQMHVPGAGNRELLYVDDHGAAPAGVGGPSVWRARDDIRFGCTTSVANGSGQGFIAIDSEGTKTTFDVMIERGNGVLTKMLTRWGTTNFPRTGST